METATDQKKKQIAAPKAKAVDAKTGGDVGRDKEDLGAMLRPDKAAADKQVAVGAKTDQAEKEADKVADAVVKPEAATGPKDEKDPEEADPAGHFFAAIRGPPIRAGPEQMIRRVVADQNGTQPNTDELSTVPAIDGQLTEVGVSASEEAEFDEMSGNDFSVLGDGQNAIMMKSAASQTWHRPDYLPSSLTRLLQNPGTGSRLPSDVRTRMETRLGVDLSRVRVHRDQNARVLTAHVQARAFAYGRDIFLRNPGDVTDIHLMAHETAHCIQQGAARPLIQNPARGPPAQTKVAGARAPPTALRRLDADGDDGWLERRAEGVADRFDFYGLLKVMIGRRLFTGKSVTQNAMSYVGAFMKFIGAEETFEQMKQSGSLEDGFQKIREGAEKYNLNWPRVRELFSRAYDDFEWTSPISSLKRIFKPFFTDLFNFGKLILKVVAELVAEAFVIGFGPRGKEVWDKIKAIGEVIGLVIANPLGFAKNLIQAAALGIKNFGLNILSHIKKGLLAWVLGPLAAMGVTLPEKLDLRGVINVLLQVLGLTYPQLRPRIIRKLNPRGELKVTLVEKLISVINILRTEGIAGVWRKLLEYIDNLQMQVIEGIRNWVVRAVIEAGIRKLVAWSNPAGALLDILFTIYKLIVFFVEKFNQIISFASSIFESIGKIARGQLTEAAAYVENTLSLTIPIMISFLTSLLGLPDITGTVRTIITNLRTKVHAAVDKVLDFVIKKVKKLIAKLIGKFKSKTGEPESGVDMQGTQHKLAFEEVGSKRELFLHSEKTKASAETMKNGIKPMAENCVDPLTSQSEPTLQETVSTLETHEAHEAREARKPESNRSSPDNNKKRDETVAKLKEQLEKATHKDIAVTDAVKTGQEDRDEQPDQATLQEGETVAEDQKSSVEADMEDYNFRYVIVAEKTDLEGSWGTWSDMQGKRTEFKAFMETEGLEGRYAVDLDHNPEYQIMWRLGHLAYRDLQRDGGQAATEKGRIFPNIAALYSFGDLSGRTRDRKSGDKDFVMGIRYDAHRQLPNTQSGLAQQLDGLCEYSARHKSLIPKSGKEEEVKGFVGAQSGQIEASATEHQNAIVTAYDQMHTDSFVQEETVSNIKRSGTNMIAEGMRVLKGGSLDPKVGEEAEGQTGGIGMQADPIDAEMLTGNYGDLAGSIAAVAKKYSSVFDKHHLVEHSILQALESRFQEVKLLPALKDQSATVAGLNVPGAPLGEIATAALSQAQTRLPALAGADVTKTQSSLMHGSGFSPQSVMKEGDVHKDAFAISVLKVVNGTLGSQSVGNVASHVQTHFAGALASRAAAAKDAVTNGYAGLSVPDDASPQDAEAALAAKTTEIRANMRAEATDKLKTDLGQALGHVLNQLVADAHGEFVTQQGASLRQTLPSADQFPSDSEEFAVLQRLNDRYANGPGNLAKVQEENRRRWVA